MCRLRFRNANGWKGIPKTGLLLEFDRKSALAPP
jgi:hypothetical protein